MTKINRAPDRVVVRRAAAQRAAVLRAVAQNRAAKAERAHPAIVNSIFVPTKTPAACRVSRKKDSIMYGVFFSLCSYDSDQTRSMTPVGDGVKSLCFHYFGVLAAFDPFNDLRDAPDREGMREAGVNDICPEFIELFGVVILLKFASLFEE